MFSRPRDRDVVCHASAWDIDRMDDLRIKMCIKIDDEDLVTVHHELGHDYYFHYYKNLLPLFQSGANDGFHEGIGDTLALSVTPSYLTKIGIFDNEPPLVSSGRSDGSRSQCPTGPCNGNTYPGTYDALGRYFFIGATLDF